MPLRLVGVVGRLYVVLESDRGLVLMDQHAAHERILYEQMLRRLGQGDAPSQRLLLPETVELSPRDAQFLREHLQILGRLGVGLSEFGERTFLLDALPPFVKVPDARRFVLELIDQLVAAGQEVNSFRLGEQTVAKTVSGIEVDLFRPDDEVKRLARLALELGVAEPLMMGSATDALRRVAEAPDGTVLCIGDRLSPRDAAAFLRRASPARAIVLAAGDEPELFQDFIDADQLFFLSRHPDGGFYAMSNMSPPITLEGDEGKKTLESVKKVTAALADPMKGLKSESAEDRYLTAAMLIRKYRGPLTVLFQFGPPPAPAKKGPKEEPIDPEQSKLILQALAAADWTPKNDITQLSPLMVLHRLPLTKDDGWTPPSPKDAKEYTAYAQRWVRDHVDSYRIQKFAAEKSK